MALTLPALKRSNCQIQKAARAKNSSLVNPYEISPVGYFNTLCPQSVGDGKDLPRIFLDGAGNHLSQTEFLSTEKTGSGGFSIARCGVTSISLLYDGAA